jgi:lycopene cyclase domain-containing protein
MKTEYLLVLAATVIIPLILSRDRNIRIRQNKGLLLGTTLFVSAIYWVWDIAATARGHWSFNPAYVLDIRILGLPAEEYLFFPVIIFVSIVVWESVRYFMRRYG